MPYEPFSIRRLVNKRVLRGRIRKNSSLFLFFFFLFSLGLYFFDVVFCFLLFVCCCFFYYLFIFYLFFFLGGGGVLVLSLFRAGGGGVGCGTPLVVGNHFRATTSYYWYSMEMSYWGGGGANQHVSFLYSKYESYIQITMWLSNFDVDIYNFTMDNFKLNSASYRTGTFL